MAMTERAVAFALGANLGDRQAALQGAVDGLARIPGLRLLALSPVVETDPVGGPEQPDYLNAVLVGVTTLGPLALLDAAQGIESAWHRTREVHWGPRTLDIDILALEGIEMDSERLTLPHPRAHVRGFVLIPWAAADPAAEIAGHGMVAELARAADDGSVRPTDFLLELPREGSP